MDPRALSELIPTWAARGAPLKAAVSRDRFLMLSEESSRQLPNWLLPECFLNDGNYIISLPELCRWLGEHASELGVEIYPDLPAAKCYTPLTVP